MSSVSQSVIYEYPLQERFRTYLRLEHSFKQLQSTLAIAEDQSHDWQQTIEPRYEAFFNALFACQELVERSDIRAELSKDLEQQRLAMKQWEKHPQIDQTALQGALRSIVHASESLQQLPAELRQLKADRFLASIRTRLAQPGISGLFELPQLQLWLNQPANDAMHQCQQWYQSLQPLATAIELQLELTRQQSEFTSTTAKNGFWQESCEPLAMLRIKVPATAGCYPVVSGHRQRFTIRFMQLPTDDSEQTDACSEDLSVAIARCQLL
ncbi:MAG: cell division protein ZapD [Pseudomonadota bacterium]